MDRDQFAQTPAGLDVLMCDFAEYKAYVLAAPQASRDFLVQLNGGKYHGHGGKLDCRNVKMRNEQIPKWVVIEWIKERRFRAAGELPFVLFECIGNEPSARDLERLHAGFIETKKDFIKQINDGRAARSKANDERMKQSYKEAEDRLKFYWGKSIYDMKQEQWRGRMARGA